MWKHAGFQGTCRIGRALPGEAEAVRFAGGRKVDRRFVGMPMGWVGAKYVPARCSICSASASMAGHECVIRAIACGEACGAANLEILINTICFGRKLS